MNSINVGLLKGTKEALLCWRERIPFIDKRDGFTSERMRVHMLLVSIAHAGGYKIMVGTNNTVGRHYRV